MTILSWMMCAVAVGLLLGGAVRRAEALPGPTPVDTEVNRWFTYLGLQPRLG